MHFEAPASTRTASASAAASMASGSGAAKAVITSGSRPTQAAIASGSGAAATSGSGAGGCRGGTVQLRSATGATYELPAKAASLAQELLAILGGGGGGSGGEGGGAAGPSRPKGMLPKPKKPMHANLRVPPHLQRGAPATAPAAAAVPASSTGGAPRGAEAPETEAARPTVPAPTPRLQHPGLPSAPAATSAVAAAVLASCTAAPEPLPLPSAGPAVPLGLVPKPLGPVPEPGHGYPSASADPQRIAASVQVAASPQLAGIASLPLMHHLHQSGGAASGSSPVFVTGNGQRVVISEDALVRGRNMLDLGDGDGTAASPDVSHDAVGPARQQPLQASFKRPRAILAAPREVPAAIPQAAGALNDEGGEELEGQGVRRGIVTPRAFKPPAMTLPVPPAAEEGEQAEAAGAPVTDGGDKAEEGARAPAAEEAGEGAEGPMPAAGALGVAEPPAPIDGAEGGAGQAEMADEADVPVLAQDEAEPAAEAAGAEELAAAGAAVWGVEAEVAGLEEAKPEGGVGAAAAAEDDGSAPTSESTTSADCAAAEEVGGDRGSAAKRQRLGEDGVAARVGPIPVPEGEAAAAADPAEEVINGGGSAAERSRTDNEAAGLAGAFAPAPINGPAAAEAAVGVGEINSGGGSAAAKRPRTNGDEDDVGGGSGSCCTNKEQEGLVANRPEDMRGSDACVPLQTASPPPPPAAPPPSAPLQLTGGADNEVLVTISFPCGGGSLKKAVAAASVELAVRQQQYNMAGHQQYNPAAPRQGLVPLGLGEEVPERLQPHQQPCLPQAEAGGAAGSVPLDPEGLQPQQQPCLLQAEAGSAAGSVPLDPEGLQPQQPCRPQRAAGDGAADDSPASVSTRKRKAEETLESAHLCQPACVSSLCLAAADTFVTTITEGLPGVPPSAAEASALLAATTPDLRSVSGPSSAGAGLNDPSAAVPITAPPSVPAGPDPGSAGLAAASGSLPQSSSSDCQQPAPPLLPSPLSRAPTDKVVTGFSTASGKAVVVDVARLESAATMLRDVQSPPPQSPPPPPPLLQQQLPLATSSGEMPPPPPRGVPSSSVPTGFSTARGRAVEVVAARLDAAATMMGAGTDRLDGEMPPLPPPRLPSSSVPTGFSTARGRAVEVAVSRLDAAAAMLGAAGAEMPDGEMPPPPPRLPSCTVPTGFSTARGRVVEVAASRLDAAAAMLGGAMPAAAAGDETLPFGRHTTAAGDDSLPLFGGRHTDAAADQDDSGQAAVEGSAGAEASRRRQLAAGELMVEPKVPLAPNQLPSRRALASRALQVPQVPQDSTGAPLPHLLGVVADDEEPQGDPGGVPSDRCGAERFTDEARAGEVKCCWMLGLHGGRPLIPIMS